MRLYEAVGVAAVVVLSGSVFAFLPLVQHQIAALAADGRQCAPADEPLLHLASATAPVSVVLIPIIAHLLRQVELPEPVPTELLGGRADRLGAPNLGTYPPLLDSARRRAPVIYLPISIITLFTGLQHPIPADGRAWVAGVEVRLLHAYRIPYPLVSPSSGSGLGCLNGDLVFFTVTKKVREIYKCVKKASVNKIVLLSIEIYTAI